MNVDAFFTIVYVDDYLFIRVQHSGDDRSALMGSASVDSHYVPLFGPREEGVTAILTLKGSTDKNTMIDALGFNFDTRTLKIS